MRSLTLKLTLAFVAVSLVQAVLGVVFVRQATVSAFNRFLKEDEMERLAEDAAAYYDLYGTWEGALEAFRPGNSLQQARPSARERRRPPAPPPRPRASRPKSPAPFVLLDPDRYVVLPSGTLGVGERLDEAVLAEGVPVVVDGVVVGTVVLTGAGRLSQGEVRYLARTHRALLYATLGAVGIALVIGLLLARTYTRPLRELTGATQAMARGALGRQVPVRSQDELGALTESFNTMSTDLAEANTLRRQMTADIAHDLRTPLTVLSGYLEALREGVLKPTQERFDMMYAEAAHLNRLIEDLRTLSLADAGQLTLYRNAVAPGTLLERTAASFALQAKEKDIALVVEAEEALPDVWVDFERMVQVLGNLVSNALRYTLAGGQITLAARADEARLYLSVQDTGTGIPADALARVFRRFYRADPSRPQDEGESGLGLAIARSLVEAHGGTISVESDEGQGARFTIVLPYSSA